VSGAGRIAEILGTGYEEGGEALGAWSVHVEAYYVYGEEGATEERPETA
jgi:hypothetical protein